MGQLAKNYRHAKRRLERAEDPPPAQEARTLRLIQREARRNGATLAHQGKGGLPPGLVLHVLRRDEWKCPSCGTRKNLGIHHKGGIVESKWLSKQGHQNKASNLVTICDKPDDPKNAELKADGTVKKPCHDRAHEKARRDGTDSSQVTPIADKGTKRDHGLPTAKPTH